MLCISLKMGYWKELSTDIQEDIKKRYFRSYVCQNVSKIFDLPIGHVGDDEVVDELISKIYKFKGICVAEGMSLHICIAREDAYNEAISFVHDLILRDLLSGRIRYDDYVSKIMRIESFDSGYIIYYAGRWWNYNDPDEVNDQESIKIVVKKKHTYVFDFEIFIEV